MRFLLLGLVALLVASCGPSATPSTTPRPLPAPTSTTPGATMPPTHSEELCPDVLAVDIEPDGTDTYQFSVTLRSPDTQTVYADRWEVVAPSGEVLATRVLTHPHIDEQPFTRSLGGVEVPDDLTSVTVRAGMTDRPTCGSEVTIRLP